MVTTAPSPGSTPRARRTSSRPLIPGIMRLVTRRSGRSSASAPTASLPDTNERTAYPSRWRIRVRRTQICVSSSTTKTVGFFTGRPAPRPRARRRRRRVRGGGRRSSCRRRAPPPRAWSRRGPGRSRRGRRARAPCRPGSRRRRGRDRRAARAGRRGGPRRRRDGDLDAPASVVGAEPRRDVDPPAGRRHALGARPQALERGAEGLLRREHLRRPSHGVTENAGPGQADGAPKTRTTSAFTLTGRSARFRCAEPDVPRRGRHPGRGVRHVQHHPDPGSSVENFVHSRESDTFASVLSPAETGHPAGKGSIPSAVDWGVSMVDVRNTRRAVRIGAAVAAAVLGGGLAASPAQAAPAPMAQTKTYGGSFTLPEGAPTPGARFKIKNAYRVVGRCAGVHLHRGRYVGDRRRRRRPC